MLQIAFILRALLWPHREPASRMAWVTVIAVTPVVGMLAYALFGEPNIGRRRYARLRRAEEQLPPPGEAGTGAAPDPLPEMPPRFAQLFRVGTSISGFLPVAGNSARLMQTPTPGSTPSSPTSTRRRAPSTCSSTSGCPTTTA